MAVPRQTASALVEVDFASLEPSLRGPPRARPGLCKLARPHLRQAQHSPQFQFHEASVLLIVAGRMDLDDGVDSISVDSSASLLLVEADTCAEVLKVPGAAGAGFTSIFLSFSAGLIDAFRRDHLPLDQAGPPTRSHRQLRLDQDLAATLHDLLASIADALLSDQRLQYRLLDFLSALAERGHIFRPSDATSVAGRLRRLIGEAPAERWTAHQAGRALAMSEATLHRRLATARVRFEEVLIDTRMQHALMLLQTTGWSIPHIAQACGYQSRARFSERFLARFGCLPSALR